MIVFAPPNLWLRNLFIAFKSAYIVNMLSIYIFFFQEIRQLCSYLHELKKASAEEMRRSVYANYAAFIRLVSNLLNLFN